jgi:hypothetical protein
MGEGDSERCVLTEEKATNAHLFQCGLAVLDLIRMVLLKDAF